MSYAFSLNYPHDGRCIWCDQTLPEDPFNVDNLSFCDTTCAYEWAHRYDDSGTV